MSQYLDDIHDGLNKLRAAQMSLDTLAEAFAITGNDNVAVSLDQLRLRIESAEKLIDKAVGEEINRTFNYSMEQANATVVAALTAAMRGQDND